MDAAVERTDGGVRKRLDCVEEVLEAAIEPANDRLDGEAGAESLAARSGDQQNTQSSKRCQSDDMLANLRDIVGVDAIVLLGAPQAQCGDAMAHFDDGKAVLGSLRFFHGLA